VYAGILLKFVLKHLGLLDDIVQRSIDAPADGLKNLYIHLYNRRFSEARAVWERFYFGSDFQNEQIKSSFLAILGFLLFLEDRNDKANHIFASAISLNKYCTLAYLGRGLLFQGMQQKQDAINDLSQAIKLDPQLSLVYNERGVLHQSRGKSKHAIQDFKMALHTRPDNVHAMINLSILLFQREDYSGARNWLAKAMQIDGLETKSYISLMKLKINTKNYRNSNGGTSCRGQNI